MHIQSNPPPHILHLNVNNKHVLITFDKIHNLHISEMQIRGVGVGGWRCGGALSTVPKVIHFSRYNMKCSGETRYYKEYFMQYSYLYCFPLHFMLYRGNLDYFLDSVRMFPASPLREKKTWGREASSPNISILKFSCW